MGPSRDPNVSAAPSETYPRCSFAMRLKDGAISKLEITKTSWSSRSVLIIFRSGPTLQHWRCKGPLPRAAQPSKLIRPQWALPPLGPYQARRLAACQLSESFPRAAASGDDAVRALACPAPAVTILVSAMGALPSWGRRKGRNVQPAGGTLEGGEARRAARRFVPSVRRATSYGRAECEEPKGRLAGARRGRCSRLHAGCDFFARCVGRTSPAEIISEIISAAPVVRWGNGKRNQVRPKRLARSRKARSPPSRMSQTEWRVASSSRLPVR